MQKLRKGDLVEIRTGEHRSKRGHVLSVLDDGGIIVENVNLRWKHLRRSQQHPQGGRVEKEAPIDRSNVLVVSQETDKPQRVRIVAFQLKDGDRVKTLRYRVGAKDQKPISATDKDLYEKHMAVKG